MSDRWQLVDTAGDDPEIELSTVELPLAHGPNRNQTHETCAFWDGGSYVLRRYESRPEAADGHEEILSLIEAGEYRVEDIQHAKVVVDDE